MARERALQSQRSSALRTLNPLILTVLIVPVFLTVFFVPRMEILHPPFNSQLIYSICSWAVVFFLFLLLKNRGVEKSVFLFKKISPKEVAAALLCFVIGVGMYFPVQGLLQILGLPGMQGMGYEIQTAGEFLTVFFFAVITAPVAEEILFRGLGTGFFLSRNLTPRAAGAASLMLFALIHLPYFGVGGVAFITFWGILPTYLRLRFNSLSPGLIMHMCNNFFAYIIVVLFL
ncbi:MAG: CPBP family intramembrane glutamic endopeptidase [Fibrobacterota bacterium]